MSTRFYFGALAPDCQPLVGHFREMADKWLDVACLAEVLPIFKISHVSLDLSIYI